MPLTIAEEWPLVHLVPKDDLRCDPGKTGQVNQWPTPTSVDEALIFLKLYSCNRHLVDNFVQVTEKPTNLLKNKVNLWAEKKAAHS